MCKCAQENCDLDIYENSGKCILHSEDKNKNIEEFWKEIREKISNIILIPSFLNSEKEIIIENIFFPRFERDFKLNTKQSNNSFFHKTEKIFELKVKFINCIFWEETNFVNISFKNGVVFDNCEFNGLILKNKVFPKNSKVRIQNCLKIENADFENTTFEDLADFCSSTFVGKTNFKRTTFKDISVFSNVTFRDNIDFRLTTFEKLAQFKETIFEKKLNLEDTIIKEKINFLKTKTVNNENLKPENIENRETARIIKDSFEQQNNIIEANEFYALEMKERENELSTKKDFFEWIVFKTHGLVSNHSQDWVLVLFWIISLTFITSFIKIIDSNISQLTEKIILSFIVTVIVFFININISNTKKIYYIICSSIYYILYAVFTKDCTLNIFSNTINPFSIMTGKEELTFGILLYKITIAYLIYQLIVSIRQNTRRK